MPLAEFEVSLHLINIDFHKPVLGFIKKNLAVLIIYIHEHDKSK